MADSPSEEPGVATSDADLSAVHNAGAWVARWAMRRPQRLAWADDRRSLCWAEAEERVARLVAWLADTGVGAGDRVALWLGNRTATLEGLFASARLGAIAIPVNGRLTPAEVAFQLDDSRPAVVLAEWADRDAAEQAFAQTSVAPPTTLLVGEDEGGADAYESALAATTPSPECAAVSTDSAMILMYTSSTTGKPKGALLPHRKALYNSLNAQLYFDIRSSDRVLVVAPLFHSLGLQILALPALYAGAGVVLQQGFDARRVWSTIADRKISYFGGVPTMHQRLLEALIEGDPIAEVPEAVRFAFTAGAAAPPELIRAFHERGLMMKQGYGQTETSILTCLEPEDALAKAGSVGRPVFHADLRLVTPATIEGPVSGWKDAAVGEIGEIVVRGPITMLGYWQRPEATAETLRGDWLRTGDLATRDADFDVTLVGRAREMYISGGENVYPAEIEATLVEHPEIEEAAVVALPDPEWGEVGRAHVVLRAGATLTSDEIVAWLQPRLARFKQPREILFESALPRTASGKVQKHRLG
jgi:acyl-CoA synthetase (AMP-forming)/AMP-acid ligase II